MPYSDKKVRMWFVDRWVYGFITIELEHTSKVMFDGDCELNYTYYNNIDLIKVSEEEYNASQNEKGKT